MRLSIQATITLLAAIGLAISAPVARADTQQNQNDQTSFTATAELGALGVGYNKLQFGKTGTPFDLRLRGGETNLYFNTRWSLDAKLGGRHHVVVLYQPLDIATTETLRKDLNVDGTVFPKGTVVDFNYGFSFYRGSYLYDLTATDDTRFSIGGSLQIRNANITFRSADGTLFEAQRDIGPVPLLKVLWERRLNGWWYGTEFDGIYAPVSYLNGSDNEVRGALVDWNFRAGLPLQDFADAYLFLRYLGGGAEGESEDGFNENWIHTGVVGAGFRLEAR